MINFNESRNTAFVTFSSEYNCKILSKAECEKVGLHKYIEVWEVQTEIPLANEEQKVVTFYISFEFDFPLSLPIVYISQEHYDQIKFIPHINSRKHICTFAEDTIKTHTGFPYEIVKTCFVQAKRTIEVGLKGENKEDINEEFIAYWEDSYGPNDKVEENILSIAYSLDIESMEVPVFILSKPISSYNYIIHSNDTSALHFEEYLTESNISFTKDHLFYLGDLQSIFPPFFINNTSSISLIENKGEAILSNFYKYINKKNSPRIVLFSRKIRDEKLLFGWKYKAFELNRKGFRNGSISPQDVLFRVEKNTPVVRLKVEDFSNKRIHSRTSGDIPSQRAYKFLIAGVGSIGSNLLHFLKSFSLEYFTLIDTDQVKLENIGRYYLGFGSLKLLKINALKDFLTWLDPKLRVNTHFDSIVKLLLDKPSFLNEHDILFVAIGKDNIEEYIISAIKEGIIKKPVFVFWVEPYLSGGHMLYIHPENSISYADLYVNGLYRYNVLCESVYSNPENNLILKEAGCQGPYIPYAHSHVLLFLSAIFPEIYKTIMGQNKNSFSLTWIGEKNILTTKGLTISEFADKLEFGQIVKNELISK